MVRLPKSPEIACAASQAPTNQNDYRKLKCVDLDGRPKHLAMHSSPPGLLHFKLTDYSPFGVPRRDWILN